MLTPVRWTLRSGLDRRFRTGHPWVFSNELAQPPKGEPGGPVELLDNKGGFLARGYGNPHSLISFRVLTRDPSETDPWSLKFLETRLRQALGLRLALQMGGMSFRLCFGESDFLPGLIIDRYLVPKVGQLFAVQAHTAGADRWMKGLPEVLESLVKAIPSGPSWEDTAILARNDLAVRELEGIPVEEPRALKAWRAGEIGTRSIQVSGLQLQVPLASGQKTAFYLDQAANIRVLVGLLGQISEPPKKILDLCSYVGQWGAHIATALRGQSLEITMVDASQPALDLAKKNVEVAGAKKIEIIKADVIGGLSALSSSSFDLVIADPPALVKNRKNLPAGKHAYLQLNTDVFRLVRDGGWVVSCSCSGLLEESDFIETLSKAARREGAEVSWIARGMQAADHPVLAEFSEGRYLKCWIGRVRKSKKPAKKDQ